ncbi:MAG: glycine cleavage system protein GcvH [Chloroflexi bacterium]|uniref:glycine cleavage system protein GcvH n=1 Tax=Candidatus Flexifilum breve TaxID=3140694 RepID=UPI0031359A6C|nr:glycine cleavage system protein GcvH [Chloroflexota bacterium]
MAFNIPSDLKYLKSDEWIRIEGDTATLGISDFAQDQLNDIVFVDLPEVGTNLPKGGTFGVVESVKAASDLFSPVEGVITEVNDLLRKSPETINSDPYGNGWIVKLKVTGSVDNPDLLDAAAYTAHVDARA